MKASSAPVPSQPGRKTTTGRFSPDGIPEGQFAIALPGVSVLLMNAEAGMASATENICPENVNAAMRINDAMVIHCFFMKSLCV
jgi:hypothetical protein